MGVTTHLEHGLDTPVADFLAGRLDTLSALFKAETRLDQLLAVLDEQVPYSLVADRGNLDELGETVSHLTYGERLEERKVEKGV